MDQAVTLQTDPATWLETLTSIDTEATSLIVNFNGAHIDGRTDGQHDLVLKQLYSICAHTKQWISITLRNGSIVLGGTICIGASTAPALQQLRLEGMRMHAHDSASEIVLSAEKIHLEACFFGRSMPGTQVMTVHTPAAPCTLTAMRCKWQGTAAESGNPNTALLALGAQALHALHAELSNCVCHFNGTPCGTASGLKVEGAHARLELLDCSLTLGSSQVNCVAPSQQRKHQLCMVGGGATLIARKSQFEGPKGAGVLLHSIGSTLQLQDCQFLAGVVGVSATQQSAANLSDCTFSDQQHAVEFEGSRLDAHKCDINWRLLIDAHHALAVTGVCGSGAGACASLRQCTIHSTFGSHMMDIRNGAILDGIECTLKGGQATVCGHGSSIHLTKCKGKQVALQVADHGSLTLHGGTHTSLPAELRGAVTTEGLIRVEGGGTASAVDATLTSSSDDNLVWVAGGCGFEAQGCTLLGASWVGPLAAGVALEQGSRVVLERCELCMLFIPLKLYGPAELSMRQCALRGCFMRYGLRLPMGTCSATDGEGWGWGAERTTKATISLDGCFVGEPEDDRPGDPHVIRSDTITTTNHAATAEEALGREVTLKWKGISHGLSVLEGGEEVETGVCAASTVPVNGAYVAMVQMLAQPNSLKADQPLGEVMLDLMDPRARSGSGRRWGGNRLRRGR